MKLDDPIIKIAKELSQNFGCRQIVVELGLAMFCLLILALEILSFLYYRGNLEIFILKALDLGTLFMLQLCYIWSANRFGLYSGMLLSFTTVVLAVEEAIVVDILDLGWETTVLFISEIVCLLILALGVVIHLYKMEMDLQRIRVLFGARY